MCTRIRFTTSDGYRHSICGTEDVGDQISVVTDGTRVLRVDDHDGFAVSVSWGLGVAVLASLAIALYGAGRGMPSLAAIRAVRRQPVSVTTPELDAVWHSGRYSHRGFFRWWHEGKNYEFFQLRLYAEDGQVIHWTGRLREVGDEATGQGFPCALWWETAVLVGRIENAAPRRCCRPTGRLTVETTTEK